MIDAALSLKLNGLRVQDQLHKSEILSVQSANLKKLKINGLNKIQVGSLSLNNYSALQRISELKSSKSHVIHADNTDKSGCFTLWCHL